MGRPAGRFERRRPDQGHRVNHRIRVPEVRVLYEGEQLGVMSTSQALRVAEEKGFDLVEISPGASPPVCRIMDYGKYKYGQAKRDRDQQRKHKASEVKLIRLRPNIYEHDVEVKLKTLRRFIEEGDKVRVNMMFRSRELSHPEIGRQVLLKIAEQTADIAVVEAAPRTEGRMMSMMLAPKVTSPSPGS